MEGELVSRIPSANVGFWIRALGKSFHKAGRPGKRFFFSFFPFPFSAPAVTRGKGEGQPAPSIT